MPPGGVCAHMAEGGKSQCAAWRPFNLNEEKRTVESDGVVSLAEI